MDKQQREYIHHLMLQYSDAMVRLTYRRVGDWHLAEDLVQETFLTACCKSERVCGHKKPVAWLFETLNNLTLRESRRFYHTEVSIEDIAESYELTELPMACHIPMGLDQCAERVEAIAHDARVLSGCSLNFLLDSKGLSHSTGSIPSSPDHSCEITVFRMIPCLRPKSLTDSQHGFQLLCLLLVHF